jgi:hypothetical protein
MGEERWGGDRDTPQTGRESRDAAGASTCAHTCRADAGALRACSIRQLRQHTSAYVSIRQHTSASVSIRQHTSAYVSVRQHTAAYVSIRQRTSAYVSSGGLGALRACLARRQSIRQHTLAYISIHQHTSASVSMRQHTSAYVQQFAPALLDDRAVYEHNDPLRMRH